MFWISKSSAYVNPQHHFIEFDHMRKRPYFVSRIGAAST
jgi:hypothetical protein